jgi:GNAT superfamily N-acetyltransferase
VRENGRVVMRPASEADLPALHDVFRAAVEELYERHRFEPPRPPREVFVRQHAHMLEHDGERFWVAEDEGHPVAFVAAIVRGEAWFLSALFVLPSHQSAGVGKELLGLAWRAGEAGIRRRLTIVDAIQPISTGLYSRAGLLPVTPLLSLAGEPRASDGSGLTPGPVDEEALAALDRAAYGFDRSVDHEFWRREARLTLWLRDDKPVAYAYRWAGGRIGPVAGRTPGDAGDAVAAELERAAGRVVSLVVPGSARPALAAALGAGLRYSDPPGLVLATDPAGPAALVPYGYSLF